MKDYKTRSIVSVGPKQTKPEQMEQPAQQSQSLVTARQAALAMPQRGPLFRK